METLSDIAGRAAARRSLTPQARLGTVQSTAAALTDLVFVSLDDQPRFKRGPCRWPQGPILPQKGDACLLIVPDNGPPWILEFWSDTAVLAGGDAPGGWTALGTALAPKWRTPANTSITDLADPFCPRYYVDRGRVYLGGVILLDNTIADTHNSSWISAALPAPAHTARDQHFRVGEDIYFSGAGWAGDIAFVDAAGTAGASRLMLTNHPPDGIAVALDAISYRT